MDSLANRYAYALWSLAEEENLVSLYQEKVQSVYDILKANPEYLRILSSHFLKQEEKHQLVEEAFADLECPYIVSFIHVIMDHHRIHEIFPILREFHSLCNDSRGIQEGIVYSVIPLSAKQMEAITKAISQKMQQQVEFKNQIDERLIGGIKVVVHDHIFDGSILHKITSLKQNLLQGKAEHPHGNESK